ncbi:hypothetical protein F5Y10DRAFT_294315 [Nemania abortiva]|nr:hypothetical protein F5Y10DRAFT_294315 [Nemania abortiva]
MSQRSCTKTKITLSPVSNRTIGSFISSKQGVDELQKIVMESLDKYESNHKQSKAVKWLRSFSQRVLFYADVLEVFVQHHPEYVALVWGTMKFLFVGVTNHEATICKLAKTLSKVADTLPRVKLATILYPTDRMRTAVIELHTYILRFLIRAYAWYQEGSWAHLLHSFTRPSELRYDDLIETIAEKSRVIDQLATSCQQAEFRDVHEKVNAVNDKMDTMFSAVNIKLEDIATTLQSQTSALVSTDYKLSDLQFANIMVSISDTNMADPVKTLHYLLAARRRACRSMTGHSITLSRRFWKSPKLRTWNLSRASDIAIMKGNFQSRQAVRHFCVDIIEYLSGLQIPLIHALRVPQESVSFSNISYIDVLKYIIRQVLQLQQTPQTEKFMSLSCANFHKNHTETEWFQVLELVLSQINGPLYIILDLELVHTDLVPSNTFSWLSAFREFFERLSARSISPCLKVLLITYGPIMPLFLSQREYSEFVITANIDQARRHRRGAHQDGVKRLGYQMRRGTRRIKKSTIWLL